MNHRALDLQSGEVRVRLRLRVVLPPRSPVAGGGPGQISPEKSPPAVAAEVFVDATIDDSLPEELPVLLIVPVVSPAPEMLLPCNTSQYWIFTPGPSLSSQCYKCADNVSLFAPPAPSDTRYA